DPPLLQRRSFFGVLKVESGSTTMQNDEGEAAKTDYHTLTHGTTMHGKQYLRLDLREKPVTYYTLSGPVGHVMTAYNRADRPVGVIGLGTGSMATYALPGQTMTFYDIDPVVRDISFNTPEYFSYVNDAKLRGAKISDLVLGDARLTLDRNDL